MRLVKLSTAAAVAAGLATSASAVELTEAIKGVDVSGYVRYRMESFGNVGDDADARTDQEYADNNTHRYKYRVKTTVPVNDDVSAVMLVGNNNGEDALNEDAYGNSEVGVLHAYFQYTGVENLTVQAGKIPMPTPFNDDQHGNGAVGLYNAGPVTIGAGIFDSSNAAAGVNVAAGGTGKAGANIAALGVIGSMGMVNASAWFADHQDTFDAYSIAADANVMENDDMTVNVGARHTALTFDSQAIATAVDAVDNDLSTPGTDNTLTQFNVSADIANFNVRADYAMTDEDGGMVGYDTDAATNFQLENLSMRGYTDADAYRIGAGATFGKLTASLDYMDMEYDTATANDVDADELLPAVEYQMSDNFNVRLFHSMREDADVDNDETQLELRYDF